VAILLYIVFKENPDQGTSILTKLVEALAMTSRTLWLSVSGLIHIVVGTLCAVTAWFIKEGKLEMLEENLPADIYSGIAKDKMLIRQRTGAGSCGSVLVTTAVVLLLTGFIQIAMALLGHEMALRTVKERLIGCIGVGLVMILEVVTTISVVHLDGTLLVWKDSLIDLESELCVLAPILAFLLHTTVILQVCLLKFSTRGPIKTSVEISFLPNARLTPMLKSTPKLSPPSLMCESLVPSAGAKYDTLEHNHAQSFLEDNSSRARVRSCFVESTDRVQLARKTRAKFPLTTDLKYKMNTLRVPTGETEVKSPQVKVVIHGPSGETHSDGHTYSRQKYSDKRHKSSDVAKPLDIQHVNDQTPLMDDVFDDVFEGTDFKETDNPSRSKKLGHVLESARRSSVHVSITMEFENRFDFPSLGKFDEDFLLYLNTSDEPPLSRGSIGSISIDFNSFSVFSNSFK